MSPGRYPGRVIRTVLAALAALAALAGSGALALPASAAPAPPQRCRALPDVQTAAKQVDAVFLGVVTDAAVRPVGTGEPQRRRAEWVVRLERIHQGELDTSPVRVVANASARGLPTVEDGQEWILFANSRGETLTVPDCSGSRRATDPVIRQVERQLGAGQAYVEPQDAPAKLAYEPLGADDPLPLSRLLAPGAGVVLIGMLGLLVTRRRN